MIGFQNTSQVVGTLFEFTRLYYHEAGVPLENIDVKDILVYLLNPVRCPTSNRATYN